MAESFGERLKRLREAKKISQEELANAIGRTGKNVRNVISNWEKDRAQPPLSEITQIADALGVTVGELVSGESAIIHEPPEGYMLISKDEVIEMQRQLLKKKETEIERQK